MLINQYKEIKNEDFEFIRNKNLKKNIRTKFCAALISNFYTTDGFRLNFINELNNYKIVDMGGYYENNVGKIYDKIEFLSSYKFSIAMENTEGEGYLSEKIIDSFLSGTIPIYYGDYMVDELINPEAYILIKGEKDIKDKIEYIKKIDNNDELYKKIISKKVLLSNDYTNKITKEFAIFFEHIFEQDKILSKRIDAHDF
jgi:glycosyltransferase involved in cell wall biosynthesis